jgi:hypothetical protein
MGFPIHSDSTIGGATLRPSEKKNYQPAIHVIIGGVGKWWKKDRICGR